MKKSILLMAGAMLAAGSATAQLKSEPTTLPDLVITQMSPNGEWAVSCDPYNRLTVVNLVTGETQQFIAEDEETTMYSPGTGNCVSNDGVVLIATKYDSDAAYIVDGEIQWLPYPEECSSAMANGITPDGKYICGSIGVAMNVNYADVMQRPVVWTRDDDGNYGEPEILPYPDEDWTGRTPQYILANYISDDGNTIAAMVVDYAGMRTQPLVYHKDAEGDWTYEFLHPELINPEGIEFPTYPGESPEMIDYMTPEMAAAYIAAQNAAWDTGEWPDPEDYMTPEQIEAYNADIIEWEEAFGAFMDAYDTAMENSVDFEMNSHILSPNGRYYAITHSYFDWWTGAQDVWPYLFDLDSGEYYVKAMDGKMMRACYVNSDGVLLSAAPVGGSDYMRTGYIALSPEADYMPLQDYVQTKNETTYAWMEVNMVHDGVEIFDPQTWEAITLNDLWITGTPVATPDLSLVVSWTVNDFDAEDPVPFYSYTMPIGGYSSIGTLTGSKGGKMSVSMDREGVVTINGDASAISIYDVNGRCVFSAENPASTVNTGLAGGVYVIKVEGNKANNVVTKAVI